MVTNFGMISALLWLIEELWKPSASDGVAPFINHYSYALLKSNQIITVHLIILDKKNNNLNKFLYFFKIKFFN